MSNQWAKWEYESAMKRMTNLFMQEIRGWKFFVLILFAFAGSTVIIVSTSQISVLLNVMYQELNDFGKPMMNTICFFSLVYGLRAVFKLVRNHVTAYTGNLVVNVIRESVIRSLIRARQEPGELAKEYTVLTYDLTAIQELLSWRTFVFIENMIIIVIALWNIWNYQKGIAVFIALALLLIMAVSFVLGSHLQPGIQSMKSSIAKMNGFMRKNIMNQKVVRAYHMEERQHEDFLSICKQNKSAMERIRDENQKWIPAMEGFSQIALFLSLGIAIVLVMLGKSTMGFLALLNGYLFLLTTIAADMGSLIYFFISSRESVKRVFSVVESANENEPPKEGGCGEAHYSIRLEAPVIRVGGRELLRDVKAEFKKGEITVIKGNTGSGKTVLADLITQTIPRDGSRLYLDNKEITNYNVKSYWENVGYAMQKTVFFQTGIKENIRLWKTDVSENRIEELIENFDLDFIKDLEDGFDTIINSDSSFLSGGEKQRVCLARALAAKPQVIVADDSIQAIGRETLKKILDFFTEQKKHCIIILISSDRETLDYADCIYEIKNRRLNRIGRGGTL